MMHGLPLGKLVLCEYDDAWPRAYEAEAERIRRAVGAIAIDIQHIGSTAVPGLLAKPVIDIAVAVESEEAVGKVAAALSSQGYEFRGLHEDPKHYYLIKNRSGLRLFHLHVWIVPDAGWDSHLRFRDRLRQSRALIQRYAARKRQWAETSGWDKLEYSQSKDDFVREVLER